MRKVSRAVLYILVLIVLPLTTLTGCTFFDRSKETETTVQPTSIATAQVALEVTNQLNESTTYELSIPQGANVYELLNQAMIDNSSLTVEFDDFEIDGDLAYFVSSINGYNPSLENKFWSFYVNDELSQVGIIDYYPKTGDEVSFKVESVN